MRAQWEGRAMTFQDYLAAADMNVPTMRENFLDFAIAPEHDAFFRALTDKLGPGAIVVLAISESWCGDCVENLPIMARLASEYPVFLLRIYQRDTNLDIMDEYLTDGKRTIPIFVFYDRDGSEIGRFVERPQGAHEYLRQARESLGHLPEGERKKASLRVRSGLRALYRKGLRSETVSEIRAILEGRYG